MSGIFMLFKIAFRNILRNSKRNLFTILSIAFGLSFLFWVQCILNGHNKNMIETVTSTFTGDIQIHEKTYLEDRLIQNFFRPSENLRTKLNSLNTAWTERVYFPSLISSGNISYPLVLVGIDPENEVKLTRMKEDLKSGEFLVNDPECSEIALFLSEVLAQKMEVQLGDKIVVLGQDANGALGNQLFRIRGLFTSRSAGFDKSYAFTNLSCAKNIAAVDGVHEILVKTGYHDGEDTETRARIDQMLDPGTSTSTWKDLVTGVADMIKFNKAMSSLITLILFSVITLGVINSILMNIFERVREIGIMLALGTTPGQVRIIILFESLLMALLGAAIGISLGFLAVLYHMQVGFDLSPFLGEGGASSVGFSFQTTVKPIIHWKDFLQLTLIEVAFIAAAGLYPAFKASRLKPTQTIRGDS